MIPDTPTPCPIPRQTPQASRWVERYRELVAARGSGAALTSEDLAELARGLRSIPPEELRP